MSGFLLSAWLFWNLCTLLCASQVALVVKSLPAKAGDKRGVGSILGSGRSPGGEYGNLFQYSCLENPMDRGAWWATAHRVEKKWTWLERLSMHASVPYSLRNITNVSFPSCWYHSGNWHLSLADQCVFVCLIWWLSTKSWESQSSF